MTKIKAKDKTIVFIYLGSIFLGKLFLKID